MKNKTTRETNFSYTDKTTGRMVSFRPVAGRFVYSYAEPQFAAEHSPGTTDPSRGYRIVGAGGEGALPAAIAAGEAPLNVLPALTDDEGNQRLVLPDEFAVQFLKGLETAEAERFLAELGLAINERFRTPGFYLVAVPEGRGLFETMRDLSQRPGVAFVEPSEFSVDDRLDEGDVAPAAELANLWGLNNTGQLINGVAGTPGVDVAALDAWRVTKGSPNVIICVLDTGCYGAHPDIASSLLPRPEDQDWNFVDPHSSDTTDPHGHGTHVCGTAAGAENDLGIIGLAPGCKLMPLQVELVGSAGDYQRRADAINFVATLARTNPLRRYVLNFSWRTDGDITSIRVAIAEALASGVVVVAAAGNDNSDMDVRNHYPAKYDGVIAVAALASDGVKWSGSNYGSRIDVAAPGAGIYSTIPKTAYSFMNGTSMAAPHVVAAAALIWSVRPSMTVDEIRRRLRDTATPIDELNPQHAGKLGGGLLNAAAAVTFTDAEDVVATTSVGEAHALGATQALSAIAGRKRKQKMAGKKAPPPRPPGDSDVVVSDPVDRSRVGTQILGADRLSFDGYTLTWHGASSTSYTAFSGPADEGSKESVKDIGPTPQGKYAIDPSNIEELTPSDDWGSFRVRIEPYAATVDRMKTCFKLIRTGMYVHGGSATGSHGCIELNDDAEESGFFKKLKDYGRKIELEVRYTGARETAYEDTRCPY